MMKVFEVRTDQHNDVKGGGVETVETTQYVTHENDSLLGVTEYFTKHCEEYEEDLRGVREVLVIVQHIKSE